MSQHADPTTAFLWLDCDAYRGPADAARPDLTGMEKEDFLPEGFDAFGGLETGFAVASEGAASPKTVMNKRNAPYKVSRAPRTDTITFKGVDTSKAYLDTITMGGEIVQYPDNTVEIRPGTTEYFSLLLVTREGEDAGAYWTPRATLSTPPSEGAVDGETLAGSDFSIIAVQPLRKVYGKMPKALEDVTLTKVGFDGEKTAAGATTGRPAADALKADWEAYATSRGIDTTGMTKEQIIAAVDAQGAAA